MVSSCVSDSSILTPTALVYSPLHSQYVEQHSNRDGIVFSGLHCMPLVIKGVVFSDDVQSYRSCTENAESQIKSLTRGHPLYSGGSRGGIGGQFPPFASTFIDYFIDCHASRSLTRARAHTYTRRAASWGLLAKIIGPPIFQILYFVCSTHSLI